MISVIIPVYNEENTIAEIIRRVKKVDLQKEIIVIEDGSTDGTLAILEKMRHLVYSQRVNVINKGKGYCIKRGVGCVEGDIVIIQDADLEYDPEDYHKLIKPILDGKADVVYGSRFRGDSNRVLYFWHMIGNKFLTLLSNIFTNLNLTDMETCYKAFRADVIKKITIEEDRFGFEPEITAKVAKMGCRIYEVGISYNGRDYSEGKKIGVKDGFSAIRCILKYNLRRKVNNEIRI